MSLSKLSHAASLKSSIRKDQLISDYTLRRIILINQGYKLAIGI